MECEEFILPDWSSPDNPIKSERAKQHPARPGRLWPSDDYDDCENLIMPVHELPAGHRADYVARAQHRLFAPLLGRELS